MSNDLFVEVNSTYSACFCPISRRGLNPHRTKTSACVVHRATCTSTFQRLTSTRSLRQGPSVLQTCRPTEASQLPLSLNMASSVFQSIHRQRFRMIPSPHYQRYAIKNVRSSPSTFPLTLPPNFGSVTALLLPTRLKRYTTSSSF